MKIRIEISGERGTDQFGGDVRVEWPGRWVRLAAYFGTPPGSHIGLWRTRGGYSGALQGLNLRVGRRYVGPCLTVFVHTRPEMCYRADPHPPHGVQCEMVETT